METLVVDNRIAEPTLADLRSTAGLSTRDLAEKLGKSQPRIVQIEKEGVNRLDMLQELARIYGVTFEEIMAANQRTKDR